MPLAVDTREIVSSYLTKESAEGRVLNPFEKQSLPQLHKSGPEALPRPIETDGGPVLSRRPEDYSVNDSISKSWCSLSCILVDAAERDVA